MATKKKQDENKLYLVSYEQLAELSSAYVGYSLFQNVDDLKKAAKRLDKAWKICLARPFTSEED